jgi:di/tricarboxylate transporter
VSHATLSLLVLGAATVLFVTNRFPPEVVALAAALAMAAFGVLDAAQVVAGFGDPAVVFIASLLIVGAGLEAAGITAWVGQQLIKRAGSPHRLLAMLLALVALLAAIITANGAAAAMVPVAVVLALRSGKSPSRFLMPVAFAAVTGSLLALTGSPVNVIVAEAAGNAGVGEFGFFSFTLVGIPLLAGTIAICLVFGERLLPQRRARTIPANLSAHARTLARQYSIPHEVMAEHGVPDPLLTRTSGAAEVIIPPRSELIGETFFSGMVTDEADLVVLAIQRAGEDLDGPVRLAAGDALLLHGEWSALEETLADPEVLFVEDPMTVRRQAVPLGQGTRRMVTILAAMIVLLASGAIPAFLATLLAAGAVVLTGVLRIEQVYRSISWSIIVLMAAMFAVSEGITQSGAAEKLAGLLVDAVGDSGPHALLLGLFALSLVLGQLISNTATALIIVPIAVSAAIDLDVSAQPVLMSVAVATSTSFLTPVATPANLIVMGPGGYRFGDYWRLGLCLVALFGLVAILLVPVIWTF